MKLRYFKSAVAFFFLFFLQGTSIGNGQQGISYNVLRLCDGCEALELSVGATCTKPLLYAVLFFLCVGN
jgi:hypothetical protein